MTQAGVGLCAYKTTEQNKKPLVSLHIGLWNQNENMDFVIQAGYMPVTKKHLKT